MRAIGLMTGTALDGFVDAALLETDGVRVTDLGRYELVAYDESLRRRLAEAVAAARAWNFVGPEPAILAEVEAAYTEACATAARRLIAAEGPVDIVGFHGLTVLHRPEIGRTRQIGDGAAMARALGAATAFDFRSADVAAGGQGAPLAPIYHAALLAHTGVAAPAAVLNLGGVANLTWWGGGESLAAFDCGPANGPINEWVEAHGLGAMDQDGALAAAGRVHEGLLAQILDHPFFERPYPKSLDRFDFSAALARGLSVADGAATLTALAAAGVARGLALLPTRPDRLIVCGGGRKNPVLMAEIAKRARAAPIDADLVGWRGDAIEAEAFAFLAVRVRQGLAISFPGATGAPAPMPGGRIAWP
jgi:anhydro-N-acetylmuramic acid kinase